MDIPNQTNSVSNPLMTETNLLHPPPSKPKNNLFYLLLGILLLLLVVYGVYQLTSIANSSNKPVKYPAPTTVAQKKTSTEVSQDSEVISIDTNTYKYINHQYDFNIIFPKYEDFQTSCNEPLNSQKGKTPLRVFDDTKNKTLYISDEIIEEIKMKPYPNNGWGYDYSKCKVVDNNLELIKKGYDNGITDSPSSLQTNITKPTAFKVIYKKIETDTDLNDMVHTMYGSDCFINKKTLQENSHDIYTVTFADKDGQYNYAGKCPTNFVYIFLYSQQYHSAVLSSGYQSMPFQGIGGQNEPKIEFLTK